MTHPPQPVPVTGPPTDDDVTAAYYVDSGHPDVRAYAREVTGGLTTDRDRAVALFTDVRERFRYDPYGVVGDPEAYRASVILTTERNWCVPKATVLTAAARAVGIPARLGFADVKNHLSTPRLRERMGSELFIWHGYSELWIDDAWRKASPAFNADLCRRFDTPPLEFDGVNDALLHRYDGAGNPYMEYVHDRGSYRDAPMPAILAAIAVEYDWPMDAGTERPTDAFG